MTTKQIASRVITGVALMAVTSAAHAGSRSIFTGGVPVGNLQTFGCSATNISSKELTQVIVTMRLPSGAVLTTHFCAVLAPLAVCGNTVVLATGPGSVSCEVTSDKGARSLRATLSNHVTGASSDAR